MGSADDPGDNEEFEGESSGESVLPPGPRRSTYTPPTAPVAPIPLVEQTVVHDDEELANALAADISRVATSSIGVVADPDDDVPEDPISRRVEPIAPPESPATVESLDTASLATQSAPAGQPWIPQRRSLPDSELSAMMANAQAYPGGTLGVMEELEHQMRLRDEEKREFADWQESMVAVGTSEALDAVRQIHPQFSDIVTTPPPPPPAPEPVAEAAAEPAAEPVQEPDPFLEPASRPMPEPWLIAEGNPVPDRYPDPEPLLEPVPETPEFLEPRVPAEPLLPVFEPADPELIAAEPLAGFPPELVEPPPYPDFSFPIASEPVESAAPESVPISPEPPEPGATEPGEPLFGGLVPAANTFFVDGPPAPVITGAVAVPIDSAAAPSSAEPAFEHLLGLQPPPAGPPSDAPGLPEPPQGHGGAHEIEPPEWELQGPRVFTIETIALEPTPTDHRVGRAARMFWLWFAANSSVIGVVFGAVLFSMGMSLRQAIVGILAGVAISFIPLGLGALAGKRSGQPTMVVSRATFGVVGNVIPALLSLASRIFWGAVLLWILAEATAETLIGAELNGALQHNQIVLIGLGAGFVLAFVVALFGYGLVARIQLIVSILAGIFIVGFIVLTWKYVDIPAAITVADGSWFLVATAGILVFSFIGLLWANSSSDLARYQRPGSSGAGTMLSASFGAAVPTFLLISYGAVLAASNKQIALGLIENPFDTIGRLLPVWYPVPMVAVTFLSLLCGVIVSVYSGGFALQAIGIRVSRQFSIIVVSILLFAVAFMLSTLAVDLTELFRDLATTLAVPVAAWVGIFVAETMIRSRRYHPESLLNRGGVYASVRWVNLIALVLITGVGYALTTATVSWLNWQGYGFTLLGIPLDGELARTDLGVVVALLLGILVPIVAGIPAIRRQEAAVAPAN